MTCLQYRLDVCYGEKIMKIVICDDREFEIEILKKLCEEYVSEHIPEAEIVCTANPGRIAAEDPDILILDIEMPEKSGIEIKNELTEGDRPLIIFATAYFEFMKEAFGRNVIGYMEKPVKKYEFNNYMKAAVNILSLETVIHIDSETEVKSKDVLLIGTDNGYTEVEMTTGRKITGIRKSMKAWEEELQQYGFMRINDACIINCRYVKGFEGDNVVIKDIGVKLRVSRRKKADCVKFYRTYRAKSSKYI